MDKREEEKKKEENVDFIRSLSPGLCDPGTPERSTVGPGRRGGNLPSRPLVSP